MKLVTLKKEHKFILNETITNYLNPNYIYLPITSDTRLKANPIKYIYKDDLLYNLVYSPVSGKIAGVKKCYTTKGLEKFLVIQNDFKEKTLKKVGIRKNLNKVSKEEFLDLILNYDHDIYNKLSKDFKKVIINSVEEQPYIANYIFINKNYSKEVLDMLDAISDIFNIKDIEILVKDTDYTTISTYNNMIGSYPNISLKLLPNKYLITKDDNLEKILHIKDSYVYLNIEDLYYLYNYIKRKKYKEHKFITITGNAIDNPQVVMCKIGTSLEDIIKDIIKINSNEYIVLVNNILMNNVINIKDFIVTEDLRAVFIMKKVNVIEKKCINCGKCSEICPVNIKVSKLVNNKRCDITNCINCGLCTYICPSNIDINRYLKGDNNE